MFFITGISSGQKPLNFTQTILCSHCGQFGRYEVYMTYMYFSLFFIPLFKWNKEFFVKATCCNTTYTIDKSLGNRILKGENITLTDQDLHLENNKNPYRQENTCPKCSYTLSPDYLYCPKCGFRL